jgi:DNA-binding transcriptional MerR regulator
MPYTVQQLASLAGVTTRSLHHYDEIGLLTPARKSSNGYRQYGEAELLKLQQIMFFRELEFPLKEIKSILDDPTFDMATALADHRKLIEIKKKRLSNLLKTIDTTLTKFNHKKHMDDKQLYAGFSNEEAVAYAKEAKERWGHTDAYKESQRRTKKFTKDDWAAVQAETDSILTEIVRNMDKGPSSPEVQAQIARHYAALRRFYEPNLEMYRGLAHMYVDDPRFAAFYEKYHADLPVFMRDAMLAYGDAHAAD